MTTEMLLPSEWSDPDWLRSQLSLTIVERDHALGRTALAERRAVIAENSLLSVQEAYKQRVSEISQLCQRIGEIVPAAERLRRQRRVLARHLHGLLAERRFQDREMNAIFHALTLPVILWPFIGAAVWIVDSIPRIGARLAHPLRRKVRS